MQKFHIIPSKNNIIKNRIRTGRIFFPIMNIFEIIFENLYTNSVSVFYYYYLTNLKNVFNIT